MDEKYDALTQVIDSVAAEEKAAANIIRAEATRLEEAIKDNATPAQLKAINDSIAKMMDELSRNNAELAKKMDIATGAPTDPANMPSEAEMTKRKEALNNVIESVAEEESAMADLMNAEADKIRKVVTDPNATIDDMLEINASATGIVDKVGNTNEELVKKLQKAVDAA